MKLSKKVEKILPQIKLKYYQRGKNGETLKHPDAVCDLCKRKNISIGSLIDAYSKNPRFLCEDCTIEIYKEDHNFKSRKAAASHRRRMFDVNYLFNEMVTDRYIAEKGLNGVDDLKEDEIEKIMELSKEGYNNLFTKKEKIKMEETEDQKKIEKMLSRKLDIF